MNKVFNSVSDLKEYIADGIKNGDMVPAEYIKTADSTSD